MKFGVQELIIILVIVVLLFGPTQIPKLTKMFGKSVKSFKDGMSGDGEEKAEDQEKKESETTDGKDEK